MASKSLGTLTLDLVANLGGYTAGLDKAEKEAAKRAKAIENAFDDVATGVGVAIGAAGAAIAAGFAAFQVATNYVAGFQDLAEETGATAEGLASLAVAAGTAGVDMDSVAAASIKLTKNLTGVDDESKAAGAALKALGINLKDFQALDPVAQTEALSKAFAQFGDGAGKTAVALDLWGKSGSEQLKVMKALEEQGGRQVILTQKMIEDADAFADAQAQATTQLKLYAGVLAAQALPYVTAFTGALTDTIKEVLGLDKGVVDLKNNKGVQEFAEAAVRALGFVIDAVDGVVRTFEIAGRGLGAIGAGAAALASGDFTAAVNIAKEAVSDVDAILNRELFSTKLDKRLQELRTGVASAAGAADTRPQLGYRGATRGGRGGGGADQNKAVLDAQVKELERAIGRERDLISDRNKMLDLFNQQGLISISDYYAQRKAILEEGTRAQITAIDQQIKALQDYIAKAPKADQRASAQEKINDLLEKQAKLERDSGMAAIEASFQQKKATEDYQNSLRELNAQLLELQGNTAQAAEIRFDLQNAERYRRFQAEGNTAAVQQLDTIKQITSAQAQLNQLTEKFSVIQGDLQITEERISRDQQSGVLGQLDGLRKLGEARQKSLSGLQAEYAKYQELTASGGTLTEKQRQELERLQLQIESLSSSLDPLADKFNTMFADKFGDAIGSVIDGTKSAKDAFKDMINSFISDLVKLAAQDVAKSLFSGGGSATGGAGFNLGSLFSSLFAAGARANGGPVMPNSLYKVNENGPEIFQAANGSQYLMTGAQGGRVNPNQGTSINQTVIVQGIPNSKTVTQMAQETRRQTNAAQRRFG